MLESLCRTDFEGCIEGRFEVLIEEGSLELALVEVTGLSESARVPEGREPFSAVFLGPSRPILAQQTLRLRNETLGELEIFLVPIGPDAQNQGMRYEAVFS